MRLTPDQYMSLLGLPEVYRVGGSVRDELLGRQSKDSDYMVRGADLDQLETALRANKAKVKPLKLRGGGKQIGVRAQVKSIGTLEIVLPRREFSTGPGRHDFDIEIDPSIELVEDAQRRDFTINALYLNVATQEIEDPTGFGLKDIEDRAISTVHESSFVEDPLRILRALRFMSKLPGFTLYTKTFNQMAEHHRSVTGLTQKGVSGTAFNELCGILMGANPGIALRAMRDTCVMRTFLPELEEMINFPQRSCYHEKNTDEHTFDAVQAAANMHNHAPLRVRLALLFHDAGKPKMAWIGKDGLQHYYALDPKTAVELDAPVASLEAHEVWGAKLANYALLRLNSPANLRKDVVTLIERHMLTLHENIKPFKVRKMRVELGDDLLHDLITHRLCDVIGKGGDTSEAVEVLEWIANEQQRAIAMNIPTSVKDLAINGHDLKEIGYDGRDIGKIQGMLLHEVIAQPKLNNRAWLIDHARKVL